ncbi:hypothetical protein [Geodermatophilus sp. CPCC 205506]|uniref:hypothetical protein n=1 Tax=Geodermatophilus sp. CPCC 205506 TaxID=2936596 RepID=UPI003EE924C3
MIEEGSVVNALFVFVPVDPGTQEAVLRTSVVLSSLVTGTLVGVLTGAVAVVLCRVLPSATGRGGTGSAYPTGSRR